MVQARAGNSRCRRERSFLGTFVPVDPNVAGLPAHGDDVDPAIVIQICRGQIFDRHATIFEDVPGPLGSLGIQRLVPADAAPLPWFLALVVADAGDECVAPAAIEIHAPDHVPPAEFLVQHVPVPEWLLRVLRVDDYLVTVPRFDGADVFLAAFQLPQLDLAGP